MAPLTRPTGRRGIFLAHWDFSRLESLRPTATCPPYSEIMSTIQKPKAPVKAAAKSAGQAPARKTSAKRSAAKTTTKPVSDRGIDTVSEVHSETQRDVVNRLKRIEGQIRGLIVMVESGRACEDVAQQMSAARKAMDKTFYRMMACTVMEAVACTDSEGDARREVERSTRILEKYA